jgi:hypothetical protein
MAFGLRLQRAQNLIINIPSLQENENRLTRKSSAHQHAKDSCGFALILRFLQPLAIQELARELFFTNIFIRLGDRLVYDISVNAFGLQVGDNATASEFLICLSVLGISRRIAGVVQVFLLFELGDHHFYGHSSVFIGMSSGAQQSLQLRDRAHLAGQGGNRVFVQSHIIQLAFLPRAREGHGQSVAEMNRRR